MKTSILILLSMLSAPAMASEDWICKSQASVARGSSAVLSCGIGEASSESEARDLAYSQAMREFNRVCNVSDDCRGQALIVRPSRTQCEAHGDGYKCYRAISIEIQAKAKNIKDEIDKVERKLAALQEEKVQEDKLDFSNLELKFSKPNPTYWSFGLGVFVGSVSFTGIPQLQVGYGGNVKYCYKDTICPFAGVQLGNIVSSASQFNGNFVGGHAGLAVYLYKRLYAFGDVGLEYQWSKVAAALGPYGNLGLGVDFVRVQNVSLSAEASAKGGPWTQVNPQVNIFANFKF